ncbi:HdeD family acid-resistance protein [Pseudomonadota bacterium]
MQENLKSEFLEEVKKNSGLTIAAGIVILLAGLLTMGSPFVAGISVAVMVGLFLIVGGIGQLLFAIKAGRGFLAIVLGILSVIIGIYMVINPGTALATLTLFLALYLILSGIVEALMAFHVKPANGWGWVLFSGIASLVLGIMIWSQFPLSGAWAIGLLVGIKLFFSGWTVLVIGLAGRSAAKEAGAK